MRVSREPETPRKKSWEKFSTLPHYRRRDFRQVPSPNSNSRRGSTFPSYWAERRSSITMWDTRRSSFPVTVTSYSVGRHRTRVERTTWTNEGA